ncbi:hypothetical protein FACS1894191_0560 [Clostridia bacterium]|nr:hypothetical protein FACS1894191_0560 [Clostridia bacterium]
MRISKLASHQKLVWYISVLIFIQAAVLSIFFFNDSYTRASSNTQKSLLDFVVRNRMLTDDTLSNVILRIKSLNVDSTLFDTLRDVSISGSYSTVEIANGLNNQYFWNMSDYIVSVNLISRRYSSTYASFTIPYGGLARHIPGVAELKPEFLWYPREVMEDWGYYTGISAPGRRRTDVFMLVRRLNPSIVRGGSILVLDKRVERPTLVVSFKPELYDNLFQAANQDYTFFVVTPEGEYVTGHENIGDPTDEYVTSHGDIGDPTGEPWFLDALKSKDGSGLYTIFGKESVVCYSTSRVNGWILASYIPVSSLTDEATSYMSIMWLVIMLNATIIIVVMYFVSKGVTRPFYDLTFWAENIIKDKSPKDGVKSPSVKTDDVAGTISRFNSWLDDMMRKNREISMKEQDAVIAALEMQLNPHFLFNTLNIINLSAMEHGQSEISAMIVNLSGMMQYTIHVHGKFSQFSDEIAFLDKYVYLMSLRFSDKFRFTYDISPELRDAVVPKMLLQPFVENSILHGFADVESGGEIIIRAFTEEQMIVFYVEDNGAGIPPESLRVILEGREAHIGCSNVNQRIKLIFGEDYGVSVISLRSPTIIQIRFPYIKAD